MKSKNKRTNVSLTYLSKHIRGLTYLNLEIACRNLQFVKRASSFERLPSFFLGKFHYRLIGNSKQGCLCVEFEYSTFLTRIHRVNPRDHIQ